MPLVESEFLKRPVCDAACNETYGAVRRDGQISNNRCSHMRRRTATNIGISQLFQNRCRIKRKSLFRSTGNPNSLIIDARLTEKER